MVCLGTLKELEVRVWSIERHLEQFPNAREAGALIQQLQDSKAEIEKLKSDVKKVGIGLAGLVAVVNVVTERFL